MNNKKKSVHEILVTLFAAAVIIAIFLKVLFF